MNQDIDVKLFLELNNFIDFFLDGADIVFLRDPKGTRCKIIVKLTTLTFSRTKSSKFKDKTYFFALNSRRTLLRSIV